MNDTTNKKLQELDIPDFLKISVSDRKKTWELNPPKLTEFIPVKKDKQVLSKPVEPDHRIVIKPTKVAKPAKPAKPVKTAKPAKPVKTAKSAADKNGCEISQYIRSHFNNGNKFDEIGLRKFAKSNGVWKDSYSNLSNSLRVMTITNRLRSKVKQGIKVI